MWSPPRSDAPWKESTIIRENVVEEIKLKQQQPGRLGYYRDAVSATLVQFSLMGNGSDR